MKMYSLLPGILVSCLFCSSLAVLECGDDQLKEQSGFLTSPGYPSPIGESGDCKWKIYLEKNEYLTVSFEDFNFPKDSSDSTLKIGPSLGGKDTVTYSGTNPPNEPFITSSTGAKMIIAMVITPRETNCRFNMSYIRGAIPSDHSCPSGQYRCSNQKCVLSSWKCNGQNECGDNSDEIQGCPTPTPVYHNGSCSRNQFACINKTGIMTCFTEMHKCDGHADCQNGEDENCAARCSYLLQGNEGFITSPNYPNDYYSNQDCEWRVSLLEDGILQLRFLSFHLEAGYLTDYVEVFDDQLYTLNGDMLTRKRIGQYYGNSKDVHYPPTVVESSGNSMIITFHSDNSLNQKGFNASFQLKGHCIDHQKNCGKGEDNCYDVDREMCDGHYACLRGLDEVGCGNCSVDKIPCRNVNNDCFLPEERCTGFAICSGGGNDEKKCPAEICGEQQGLFLCNDGTCIQEKWMCDIQVDCDDGSDEADCALSTKVVTAAVIGSLVCGMLLVAALSCTCKLYQLYHSRREGAMDSNVPYYVFGGEYNQREAPPSYSATMASPHYADLQRAFVEGIQAGHESSNSSRTISRRRSRFLRMLSRSHHPVTASSGRSLVDVPENMPTSRRPSGGAEEPPAIVNSGNQEEILEEQDQQNGLETSSFTTSDTDSETNQDAAQQAQLSNQILNAAANIHRIRVANRLLQREHRSRRERRGPLPAVPGTPQNSTTGLVSGNSTSEPTEGTGATTELSSISQDLAGTDSVPQEDPQENQDPPSTPPCSPETTQEEGSAYREHEPAIIIGVEDTGGDRDDVHLLDDV